MTDRVRTTGIDPEELRRVAQELAAGWPQVEVVLLFGSRARGSEGERSDTDLAVLLEPGEDYWEFRLRALEWLDERLGADAADLVVLNEAGPVLRYEAGRDGVVLFEREPGLGCGVRAQYLSDYFDIAPFLERGTRALIERIQKGGLGARTADDPGIAEEARRIRSALAKRKQLDVDRV